MKRLAILAIRLYQRFVSPYKGFCCAYRAHTGRAACSELGRRAISRYGLWRGADVLRRRLHLCGVVHRRCRAPHLRPHRLQRGDCDIGCDGGCDLPGGRNCPGIGDALDCCDCGGCDGPDRKRRRRDDDKTVYIPPKSRFGPPRPDRASR